MRQIKRSLFLKKIVSISLDKRQRFILSIIVLTIGLFISEYFLGESSIIIVFILSLLTDVFLFISLKKDLHNDFSPQVFILPFLYSFSFGLFYFLVPSRLLTKIIMSSIYAIGLYSVFLSENIFTVSSVKTITLLSGARAVSSIITIISYFFLTNVLFSLHLNIFLNIILLSVFTLPLMIHSFWIYTFSKNLFSEIAWILFLMICISETAMMLWFLPSSPTLIAIFITGIFYVLVGLSQIWLERRLFQKVVFEYVWVTFIIFFILIVFTFWA